MTISTTQRAAAYLGNGVTATFAVPFQYVDAGDLAVTATPAGGTATVLTEGVHYTIAGDGTAGTAAVTLATAPATGTTLALARSTALIQSTDYVPNDGFPAESHERALDRQMLIAQELDAGLTDIGGRTVLAPAGDPGGAMPRIEARRSRLPAWSAAGDLGTLAPLPGEQGLVTLSPGGAPVAMSLRAIVPSTGGDFDGGLQGILNSGQVFDGGYHG